MLPGGHGISFVSAGEEVRIRGFGTVNADACLQVLLDVGVVERVSGFECKGDMYAAQFQYDWCELGN